MRKYIERMFRDWMNGSRRGISGSGSGTHSARYDGDIWYSYWTEIAFRKGNVLYMSAKKYSATTTRQQSSLATMASRYGLRVVEVADDYELRKIISANV